MDILFNHKAIRHGRRWSTDPLNPADGDLDQSFKVLNTWKPGYILQVEPFNHKSAAIIVRLGLGEVGDYFVRLSLCPIVAIDPPRIAQQPREESLVSSRPDKATSIGCIFPMSALVIGLRRSRRNGATVFGFSFSFSFSDPPPTTSA
jgi:hypothetical protein